jgi:hypothetical protein
LTAFQHALVVSGESKAVDPSEYPVVPVRDEREKRGAEPKMLVVVLGGSLLA